MFNLRCIHNKSSSVKKAGRVVLQDVVVVVGLGERATSGVFNARASGGH